MSPQEQSDKLASWGVTDQVAHRETERCAECGAHGFMDEMALYKGDAYCAACRPVPRGERPVGHCTKITHPSGVGELFIDSLGKCWNAGSERVPECDALPLPQCPTCGHELREVKAND